jgi:hypothetical protein
VPRKQARPDQLQQYSQQQYSRQRYTSAVNNSIDLQSYILQAGHTSSQADQYQEIPCLPPYHDAQASTLCNTHTLVSYAS